MKKPFVVRLARAELSDTGSFNLSMKDWLGEEVIAELPSSLLVSLISDLHEIQQSLLDQLARSAADDTNEQDALAEHPHQQAGYSVRWSPHQKSATLYLRDAYGWEIPYPLDKQKIDHLREVLDTVSDHLSDQQSLPDK